MIQKTLKEFALEYESDGWSITPLSGKRPVADFKWGHLREKRAGEKEIEDWFKIYGSQITGIGLITGVDESIVVLDLEAEEDPSKYDLPNTVRSRSGGGGWHYYFSIPDSYEKDTLPTTDLRKYGIVGELRADATYTTLPPSIHPNGTAYSWVVPLRPDKLLPLPKWLIDLTNRDEYQPKDWSEVMKGATLGTRNSTTVSVAGKFLHHFPKKDWGVIAYPMLHAWNKNFNHPPLSKNEVDGIFYSLSKKKKDEVKNTTTKARILYTIDDIYKIPESERPEFLVYPLIPEKGITALSGHPGCGKSWFMLEVASSVARGEAFLNAFKTKQANVLVVDEESGIWEMRRRMELLEYPKDIPVYFYSQSGFKVDKNDDMESLLQTVRDKEIGLIILDPFVAFHSGVENNAEEAQAVMEQLQRFNEIGASLLFIHHHRKGGNGGGQSLRGSSAFSGRLDSHITVEKTDETGTTQSLTIEHVKSRRGKNKEPFQMVLTQEDSSSPIQLSCKFGIDSEPKKKVAMQLITELLEIQNMTTDKLVEEIKQEHKIGERNIRDALKAMETDKVITSNWSGRKKEYSLTLEKNLLAD